MNIDAMVFEFVRIYLAVFYTAVAAFYTLRIIVKKQNRPQEVIFPGERFCVTWWNHMTFRFFRAVIWIVCLIRWPVSGFDNHLGMFDDLLIAPLMLVGILMLSFGFILAIYVHFHLADIWRSGIDPKGPEALKTTGIYGVSRNPMFLGVALAQIGFFFALPSCFTATCLLIGLYTLNSQTLAEEKHLEGVFNDAYVDYRGQVRRWF